jgi:predicted AlkP superfamily pyrophosphatase or phosphodiesterase
MKKLLFILLTMCALPLAAQKPKYVLLIGIDGLGGYAFPKAETPNIDELAKNGASTYTAKCVMPSSSSQNWASMIMGAPPKYTNIPRNGFSMKKATGTAYCGRPKGRLFPSIYTILREQKPTSKIVVLHHWDDYARLVEDKDLTMRKHTKTEDSTCIAAVDVINKGMPDLLFLHFDHVDHAGHSIGHNTDGYYKAVAKADSLVGVVITALKTAGVYDDTVIILTADHGGKGKGHGGPSLAERNIPWIISGPGVNKNVSLINEINTYDTAATIAYIMGLTQPECWKGKPVTGAFKLNMKN